MTVLSFDLDHAIDGATAIVKAIYSPVSHTIRSVIASGWPAALLVFGLFFTLTMIRHAARAKRTEVFSESIGYIGGWGFTISAVYFGVLLLEHVFMPALVLIADVAMNTVLPNAAPGLFSIFPFLLHGSPARDQFLAEFAEFYRTNDTLLPLGFFGTGVFLTAFASMYLVARATSRFKGQN